MNNFTQHFEHIKYAYTKIHTSQMHMNVCGFVIGIADAVAVIADIGWLSGDMSYSLQWYHPMVGITLILALVLIIASFYWLIKSLEKDYIKHMKKVKKIQQRQHETHIATHCGVNLKKNLYWHNKTGYNED